jgi:hypothetical protein
MEQQQKKQIHQNFISKTDKIIQVLKTKIMSKPVLRYIPYARPCHAMLCYAMPCKTFLDLLTTKRNMQRIATQHVVQASFLVCKPSTNRLTKKKEEMSRQDRSKSPLHRTCSIQEFACTLSSLDFLSSQRTGTVAHKPAM